MGWKKDVELVLNYSMDMGSRGKLSNIPRLPGYHASSAGKCIKQIAVNYLREVSFGTEEARKLQYKSKDFHSIMTLGHLYHKLIENWVNRYVGHFTDLWSLHHHQVSWLIDDQIIYGEPDIILLGPDIYVIDIKSAKSIYFWKKGGPSDQHVQQVGSYAASDEIAHLAERLKCQVYGMIFSVEKIALETHPMHLGEMILPAKEHWQKVFNLVQHSADIEMNSKVKDQPDWECQWCPLFPKMNNRPYATQKAFKDAEKKFGALCHAVCRGFTAATLAGSLVTLEDKPEPVFNLEPIKEEDGAVQ